MEGMAHLLELEADKMWLVNNKIDLTIFFFFFFFLYSLNPAFANWHGRGADTYPDPRC